MTTKYLKTTGIPLFAVNGEHYCKMIDVVRLIHHEALETGDKNVKDTLDRMEMRVSKNVLVTHDTEKSVPLRNDRMPGRYAVGWYDCNGSYHFYTGTNKEKAHYSTNAEDALKFKNYRDASACADFVEEAASVLDLENLLTEEERWQRELFMQSPYDAVEGNENSIYVSL